MCGKKCKPPLASATALLPSRIAVVEVREPGISSLHGVPVQRLEVPGDYQSHERGTDPSLIKAHAIASRTARGCVESDERHLAAIITTTICDITFRSSMIGVLAIRYETSPCGGIVLRYD